MLHTSSTPISFRAVSMFTKFGLKKGQDSPCGSAMELVGSWNMQRMFTLSTAKCKCVASRTLASQPHCVTWTAVSSGLVVNIFSVSRPVVFRMLRPIHFGSWHKAASAFSLSRPGIWMHSMKLSFLSDTKIFLLHRLLTCKHMIRYSFAPAGC